MNKVVIQFLLSLLICSAGFASSPVVLQHISFDDNIGSATLVDGGGSIDYIAGGPVGKAAEFTNPTAAGQGNYLELDHAMTDQGTLAMWLNIDQNYDYQNVWDCGTNSWTWEMYNEAAGSKFYTKIEGWPGCVLSVNTDFSLNSWFHYAWTWQRAEDDTVICKLYVNGVLTSTDLTSQTWTSPGSKFNVGGGNIDQYKYNGKIDDFYIFDNVLEEVEIAAFIADSNDGNFATDPHPYVAQPVESSDVTLSWTAPTGVESPSYEVYFKEGDADFTGITPTMTSATDLAVTVAHGNTYYWKVDVIGGGDVHKGLIWQFRADFVTDLPIAVQHIPFEDDFANSIHVDDSGGIAGSIDFITAGPVGKAAEFTNPTAADQGDHLQLEHLMAGRGTVAMWLNVDQNYDYQNVWDCGQNSWTWEMYNDSTGVFFSKVAGWPGCRMHLNTDYTLNSWIHYAWTWEKSGTSAACKLYIDGVLTDSASQDWTDPGIYFNVGGGLPGNHKYNGKMDEFYIFDDVLDADQIGVLIGDTRSGNLATAPKPYVGSTVDNDTVTLSWTAPAGISLPAYKVYVAVDEPLFAGVAPISTSATSAVYTVEHGKTYYWKVEVVDGQASYEAVVWTFDAVLGEDAPVALTHVPFEDADFDGVDYIDDQSGVAGEIQITSGGVIGSYGNFVNPNGSLEGDSFAGGHPGDSGTIAMWVKCDPASLSEYPVLWESSVAGNDWKCWVYSDNSISVRLAMSQWNPNVYVPADLTQWFHYAWTWKKFGSSAQTKLFIDGVEVDSREQNFDAHDDVIRIGGGGAWYPKFDGGMDEVYIFDRALTADQVAELVSDTKAGILATDPKLAVGFISGDDVGRALAWTAPTSVASPKYNVYFSTDPTLPPTAQVASGQSATSIAIPLTLSEGQRYYWRVDVIDGAVTHTGIVWSFEFEYLDSDLNRDTYVNLEDYVEVAANWGASNLTTGSDWLIDDFESYATQQDLLNVWQVVPDNYFAVYNEGLASLDLDTLAHEGSGALRFEYDLTGGQIDWAIADFMYVFDEPKDLSGYDNFEMWINCDASNSHEQYFYVKLFQGGVGCGGITGEYRMQDPALYLLADLDQTANPVTTDQPAGWQKITADLSKYSDLTDIHGFEIGCSTEPFGNGSYDADFGTGIIYFDDIRFKYVPKCTSPVEGDINGDCMVDISDLAQLFAEWLN